MSDPTRDDRTIPPKLLPQDTASSADEHTAGLPASPSSEGDFSFLEKPQAPDELGRLDHFRVLKELGRGGMGCVLLAEDTKLERQVALKVMLPQYAKNATAKERFLREAKAAAKIRHDHVIAILQVGEVNGVPYIAMDYLKGAPLDKFLKDKGDIPLPTVLRIGREIALGLAEAHKLGMIHRDIKPANVWLEAPKGRVKILDFGLARREEDGEAHLTQSGAIVGTPAYMAPEQATGEKLDARADLFSLGVLLYRLATGTPAFSAPTTVAMLMQVASHEPPLANDVKAGVPVEMGRMIAKLMKKKKEDRYTSAAEFLADWERLMKAPNGAATQTAIKSSEPERPPRNKPSATQRMDPTASTQSAASLGARTRTSRWLLVAGVPVVLAVGVAVWFLFLRTPNVVQRNGNQPLVNAKEPPPLDETNAAEVQAAWAAKLKVEIEEKNPTGIVMMLIPPGQLVKSPYRLGKYEVTQGEWQSVMGYNPSTSSRGARFPVEMVNWYDCVEFCNKLSEREGLKPYYDLQVKKQKGASIEEAEVKILGGTGYHIPTDPEWEHGCRAGTQGKYCFGDNDADLAEYAWYDQNSGKKAHVVGELKPNGFGLYDIHGNVREWNEDVPMSVTPGIPTRVSRGGAWAYTAASCEVSPRQLSHLGHRFFFIGLRLARDPFGEAKVAVNAAKEPPPLDATNAKEVQAAWAAKLKVEVEEKSPKTGILMTLIPPGKRVKHPYRLGKYEVTQGEWQSVMGNNPSASSKGPRFPVENVNWYDSVEFCNKLSEREGLKPYYELEVKARIGASIEDAEVKILGGTGYHIPTDPEWEHGCRAGKQGKYCFGDNDAELAEYAWYGQNSGNKSHPVGELKPNGFGVYDIHGNVREWNEELLKKADTDSRASVRGYRGGHWYSPADSCAVAHLFLLAPASRNSYIGLRLARLPFGEVNVAVNPVKEPPPLDETNAKEVQAAWAARLKVQVEETPPKMGIVMTLIPPGELVNYPYRLGKYEVTQGEWEAVMGYNPSDFKKGKKEVESLDTSRFPVEHVSWYDSVEFCNKLSEREGLKPYYELEVTKRSTSKQIDEAEVKILGGAGFRLPTVAEWEQGCRAGTKTTFSFGDSEAYLGDYAWIDRNSGKRTHVVGEKKPNAFGIYDMHGNVWEWNYEEHEVDSRTKRVLRGGSFNLGGAPAQVSNRNSWPQANRSGHSGFRLARTFVPLGR